MVLILSKDQQSDSSIKIEIKWLITKSGFYLGTLG